MVVASLCGYWQKPKTRRQKQSSHNFAKSLFHMVRRCAEEGLFHRCFHFGFWFLVFVFGCLPSLSNSRKFGMKFPKTFETSEVLKSALAKATGRAGRSCNLTLDCRREDFAVTSDEPSRKDN